MDSSIEYVIAWVVYLGLGVLFGAQLFALTAARSFFTKAMIRGHFIVLAFTPAEIAEFPGHYAPAVLTCYDCQPYNRSTSIVPPCSSFFNVFSLGVPVNLNVYLLNRLAFPLA